MTPDEIAFYEDPATGIFVAVVVAFWFAWFYMTEVSGWIGR
jgi:hypothetical protein